MFFLLDVKDGGYNVSSSSISQAPSSNPHWLTKFSRLYNKIDDQKLYTQKCNNSSILLLKLMLAIDCKGPCRCQSLEQVMPGQS